MAGLAPLLLGGAGAVAGGVVGGALGNRMGAGSGKTAKKARDLVGQYNVWLDTVLRAESENAGLLVVMLHAYCLLDEQRKGEMKRYLLRHWCRSGEWHEPELARDRLDALAAWHCRNVETLPTWLMNGNDVPDSAYESEGLGFDPDKYASEFDDEPKERARSVGSGDAMPMPDFNPGSDHGGAA